MSKNDFGHNKKCYVYPRPTTIIYLIKLKVCNIKYMSIE
jgi:hypothetical protein